MVIWRNKAILLTSEAAQRVTLYFRKGERCTMSDTGVAPISQSLSGGMYGDISCSFSPRTMVLTADQGRAHTLDKNSLESKSESEISSTQSGENITSENLVSLLTAIGPEMREEIDSIINISKKIGAINVHLDSIGENIKNLKSSLERQNKQMELIKAQL